jgi:hypothetical protein
MGPAIFIAGNSLTPSREPVVYAASMGPAIFIAGNGGVVSRQVV